MNPYSTPQNPAFEIPTDTSLDQNSLPIIRNIIASWEKIRIIYNLALAVPGLIILIHANNQNFLPAPDLITNAISIALVANLCYFAGPLLEIYLCALSQRPPCKKVRILLLTTGFVFSFAVILAAALAITSPPYKHFSF